jgi:aspartyl-tRNA(Asn)/glutamyl-tRNA(Gln) amidotransferase subunit A
MTDLTGLTIAEARARLARREISARELVDAHIAVLDSARALNAFLTETPDLARAAADRSDRRL